MNGRPPPLSPTATASRPARPATGLSSFVAALAHPATGFFASLVRTAAVSLATLARPAAASLAVIALLATFPACGPQEEWSPLDGPWDPEHPDAARILEAPDPDSPVDLEMARAGERWYRARGCLACHPVHGSDAVGPALGGIQRRRDYEWFRAMVMRPDSMLRVDPVARELLRIYRVPMPDQGATELETRAMWEYLRGEER